MGGVRFVVEGVEECGGRVRCGRSGEGMWNRGTGYREQVGGVRCVVSEVEGCVGGMWREGGRGVWWEG